MDKNKDTDQTLLIFDEDSPLVAKNKNISNKKRISKKKSRTRKLIKKGKIRENPNTPKYNISGPKDCKHILPAFQKILNEKWNMLINGTPLQASSVAGYLRGVAGYVRADRPNEYEEILVLISVARRIADERNRENKEEQYSGTELSEEPLY